MKCELNTRLFFLLTETHIIMTWDGFTVQFGSDAVFHSLISVPCNQLSVFKSVQRKRSRVVCGRPISGCLTLAVLLDPRTLRAMALFQQALTAYAVRVQNELLH